MFTRLLTGLALVAVVASCGDRSAEDQTAAAPPPPERPAYGALRGFPWMPGSHVSAVTGSAETLEATVQHVASPDSVVRWYRRALLERGWDVVGDTRLPDGTYNLHAKAPSGQPVWVMVRPAPQGGGSAVSVIGAVPDSTAN